MKTASEIKSGLVQFTGTENYYRHFSGRFNFTDGVKWLAEVAEAYWLIDMIAGFQFIVRNKDKRMNDYQFWTLTTDTVKQTATLICEADKGEVVLEHNIDFTPFPLDEVVLWLEAGVLICHRNIKEKDRENVQSDVQE